MNGNKELQPLTELTGEIRNWFDTDLGRQLLAAEQHAIDDLIGGVFGYHLLQVSVAALPPLYQKSTAGHKFVMLPTDSCAGVGAGGVGAGLVGSVSDLPFASECLDAVVLHHALDFAQSPHQLLRETARVLKPGGKLITVGFNPTSFWGMYRLFKRKHRTVPWCGHFIRQRRLDDWLVLLALKPEKVETGFYRPPLQNPNWMQRLGFIERWGAEYLSAMGGFYVSIASKESLAATSLHVGWKRRLAFPLASRPIQQAGRNVAAKVRSLKPQPEISSVVIPIIDSAGSDPSDKC